MPRRLNFRSAGCLFLLLGCLGFSNTAWAGFQWVAPPEPISSPNDVLMLPPPTSSSQAGDPLPITPSGMQATSSDSNSPLVIQGSGGSNMESPALSTTNNLNSPAYSSQSEEVVRGVAKSVPLAVALRQVLPAGYTFSIDQGVDMGTTVSFQGGRPWRETVREMLIPSGLYMREKSRVVSIGFKPDTSSTAAVGSQVTVYPQAIAASNMSGFPVAVASSHNANGGWTAEHGDTLHKVLEDWCRRSHVEFDWLAEYDFPIEATASFNGTFEDAVRSLLAGFEGAHPQPVAELHANPRVGQMVLIVQTRGNSSTD